MNKHQFNHTQRGVLQSAVNLRDFVFHMARRNLPGTFQMANFIFITKKPKMGQNCVIESNVAFGIQKVRPMKVYNQILLL